MKNKLSKAEIREELKWIEAARSDPGKFAPLYDRYYRRIFLFVLKRTGSEEITADIVSGVFIKALGALPKWKFRGLPFSSWLYRIASNEVNQFFRDSGRNRLITMEKKDIEQFLKVTGDKSSSLFDRYGSELIEILEEMPPEEVQIIELRYFEKRPFREVAYIMGITETNAKVRVHRILERMKKRILKKKEGRNE